MTKIQIYQAIILCDEKLNDIVIQEKEIFDFISILPVNKAVGPDCISHRMWKTTAVAVQSFGVIRVTFFHYHIHNYGVNDWLFGKYKELILWAIITKQDKDPFCCYLPKHKLF